MLNPKQAIKEASSEFMKGVNAVKAIPGNISRTLAAREAANNAKYDYTRVGNQIIRTPKKK